MLMVRRSAGATGGRRRDHGRRGPDSTSSPTSRSSRACSRSEFTYFRQISAVLATVTLFFGFLLITVLLTVSVNQRLGEIAALRALGFSRWRVVAGRPRASRR